MLAPHRPERHVPDGPSGPALDAAARTRPRRPGHVAVPPRPARDASDRLDLIARFGGEEFALTITDVDEASLRAIADRFRVLVERSRVTVNGRDLQAAICIGGAIAEVGDTAETLFERADAALYRAKEGGRNRVVLAGDPGASAR
jgi:predicted signal transduction protein with EAL and GGDEF domain